MSQSQSTNRTGRGELIRWAGWFGIVNALLFALVGARYLLAFGMPASGIAFVYMVLAFVAQFALLGFLPMLLLLGPVALILPRKVVVMGLGALLAAACLALLVLDTNIFVKYHYHLSRLTVEIFETSTWIFTGVIFAVVLAFQAMLAINVWRWVSDRSNRKGFWLALLLTMVWIGGQGIHIWGDAIAYSPVTAFTRYMPLYFPVKAKRRLAALGWIDPERVEKDRLLRRIDEPDGGQLSYPLQPLVCEKDQARLPNILFVLIDALRPDKISPEFTPRIAQFAAEGLEFKNHYSGGNSSRMGIFSLFYGLPSTYWQTFYDLQRPPVLMEHMAARDYETAAFSSVGYGSPSQIDRTVFAAISSEARYTAPRGGNRNADITRAWQAWLDARGDKEQPYFSFLYYDPGNFSSEGVKLAASADEVTRRYASYMQGIAAVDREVADVLASLTAHTDSRETLVIIASDHGYEFDELGLGNIGHGSNYGPYQLRSTLLMHWPGARPRAFTQRSAHQDLPGTLLQEVFGCLNDTSAYSSGVNLFDNQSWGWIMAGSYSSHAIVEPESIIVTYPGGLVELLDANYKSAPELALDARTLEEAMFEMRRFYR